MNVYQACCDTSDATELFLPQSLYLKPIARLNISVQLPQLKVPGKSISNWEVMEKVRNIIKPEQFSSLKVSKSTLDFVRLEAEIENKSKIPLMLAKLDARTIKLSGFTDVLKVRAAEAKIPYPTRHMWDSYFRDSKHMNDIKPGERPDTIHVCNLPCKWFTEKSSEIGGRDLPNEYIFKKVFEAFGEIRCVDIPILDPMRNIMKNSSGIQTFYFGQDHSFEGYIQFKEYVCFVKAMTALKGMKLLYKDGEKAWTANIKVDFDRTKHLSDESINRRIMEKEMLLERNREEKRKQENCIKKVEEERKMAREKQLMAEIRKKEVSKQLEEEKLKVVDKKEALSKECNRIKCMRLLEFLLDKARVRMERELILKKKEQLLEKMEKEEKKKLAAEEMNKLELVKKEKELRRKLLIKYKSLIQKKLENEERKINNLIGMKKKMLEDSFSNSDRQCHRRIYKDPSAEICSMSRKLGVEVAKLSGLSAIESSKWEEYSLEIPLFSHDITLSESLQSESELDNVVPTLDAVGDSNNELLTEKYIDSLSDFCQRYLNGSPSKVLNVGNSSEQQSDEEKKAFQSNLDMKRKISEKEISSNKDLDVFKKKKRDPGMKIYK